MIKTKNPCRVNRLKVVGRPTPALSSPRNHWRWRSPTDPTFGTIWHHFYRGVGPNWVQCLSSKYFADGTSRHAALLSVRQVAELFGVSTATVYRLCERGELVHLRVSHSIRIAVDDLSTYVELKRPGIRELP